MHNHTHTHAYMRRSPEHARVIQFLRTLSSTDRALLDNSMRMLTAGATFISARTRKALCAPASVSVAQWAASIQVSVESVTLIVAHGIPGEHVHARTTADSRDSTRAAPPASSGMQPEQDSTRGSRAAGVPHTDTNHAHKADGGAPGVHGGSNPHGASGMSRILAKALRVSCMYTSPRDGGAISANLLVDGNGGVYEVDVYPAISDLVSNVVKVDAHTARMQTQSLCAGLMQGVRGYRGPGKHVQFSAAAAKATEALLDDGEWGARFTDASVYMLACGAAGLGVYHVRAMAGREQGADERGEGRDAQAEEDVLYMPAK
jgi:hypothetical protein